MRHVMLASIMASAAVAAAPSAVAGETNAAMASPAAIALATNRSMSSASVQRISRWGHRVDGRWHAGSNAPGGWHAYRRPVRGWTLPRYWINPAFYIADYRVYGLPAPAYGYGWSRYYDDAVLTDAYGRVVDMRVGYDWDRFGGYDDYAERYEGYDRYDERYDRRDRSNAVAGAVAGGIVGGIAGSAIAGRGNRTEGALIGAGLGAVAGAALADGSRDRGNRDYRRHGKGRSGHHHSHGHHPAPYQGYAVPYGSVYANDDDVSYQGRWVGTWYGADGTSYSGAYDGRYEGEVQGYVPGPGATMLPYAPLSRYGYSVNGTYYEAVGSETYVAPTVIETTTVTKDVSYQVASRKPVYRRKVAAKPHRKVWRAKAKSACNCSCVCR